MEQKLRLHFRAGLAYSGCSTNDTIHAVVTHAAAGFPQLSRGVYSTFVRGLSVSVVFRFVESGRTLLVAVQLFSMIQPGTIHL